MKEIDFIPEWYKANQNRRRRYHRQYVLLACLLVLMMVWSFVIGRHVNQVHADVENMQSIYEKGQLKVNEAVALESEIAMLQQQADLLQAAAPRTNVSNVLAELSWLIPDSIVISKLSLKNEVIEQIQQQKPAQSGVVKIGAAQPKEKNKGLPRPMRTCVTLTGIAARGADAADLISRLEQSDYFNQVSPVYTKAAQVKNCEVTEFEIRAYLADYKLQEQIK